MAKAEKQPAVPPALVVFGLDTNNRPHGSYFGEADAELARKAAGMMGMYALPVAGAELMSLVANLPLGKVFASGNAFVPFVKQPTYDLLMAAGEAAGDALQRPDPTLARAAAEKPPKAATTQMTGQGDAAEVDDNPAPAWAFTVPATWQEITVGSLVLVTEEGEGWWEALVTEVANPDDAPAERLLTLQYLSDPEYPKPVRRAVDVALLHLECVWLADNSDEFEDEQVDEGSVSSPEVEQTAAEMGTQPA